MMQRLSQAVCTRMPMGSTAMNTNPLPRPEACLTPCPIFGIGWIVASPLS